MFPTLSAFVVEMPTSLGNTPYGHVMCLYNIGVFRLHMAWFLGVFGTSSHVGGRVGWFRTLVQGTFAFETRSSWCGLGNPWGLPPRTPRMRDRCRKRGCEDWCVGNAQSRLLYTMRMEVQRHVQCNMYIYIYHMYFGSRIKRLEKVRFPFRRYAAYGPSVIASNFAD